MLDLAKPDALKAPLGPARQKVQKLVDDHVEINQLEQARTKLADALKSVPQGVLFLDLDLRVLQFDAGAAESLDLDVPATLGKSVLELFPESQAPVIESMLSQPGTVFEQVSGPVRQKTVALETAEGIWIGLLYLPDSPSNPPSNPRQTPSQQESSQPPTNPPQNHPQTTPDITSLLLQIAETRTLTELTHTLASWTANYAPHWQGHLAIPLKNTLVPIAQWPPNTPHTPPIPLDELQAVRQGRPTVTKEKTTIPIYRTSQLICVLTNNTSTPQLEEIGYACGLQIQRLPN